MANLQPGWTGQDMTPQDSACCGSEPKCRDGGDKLWSYEDQVRQERRADFEKLCPAFNKIGLDEWSEFRNACELLRSGKAHFYEREDAEREVLKGLFGETA